MNSPPGSLSVSVPAKKTVERLSPEVVRHEISQLKAAASKRLHERLRPYGVRPVRSRTTVRT